MLDEISIATVFVSGLLASLPNLAAAQAGSYTPDPVACFPASCPSVSWSSPAADGPGNFVILSSPVTGNNNYISFAFAATQTMENALTVVDCYEPNGTVTVGTSKNELLVDGTKDNNDNPDLRSQLSNVAASRTNNTLKCSFTMNFPSNLIVYVFLAQGVMTGVGVVPPKKQMHTYEYASDSTLYEMMIASTAASISGAITGQEHHMSTSGLAVLVMVASIVGRSR